MTGDSVLPELELAGHGLRLRPFAMEDIELFGYWVAASARGSGFAATATDLLSGWAFESLDLSRLSLFIEPSNQASIRPAEAAGYEREGLLQRWERVNGVPKDMLSFVRLS